MSYKSANDQKHDTDLVEDPWCFEFQKAVPKKQSHFLLNLLRLLKQVGMSTPEVGIIDEQASLGEGARIKNVFDRIEYITVKVHRDFEWSGARYTMTRGSDFDTRMFHRAIRNQTAITRHLQWKKIRRG
jgi:hypothetical protein